MNKIAKKALKLIEKHDRIGFLINTRKEETELLKALNETKILWRSHLKPVNRKFAKFYDDADQIIFLSYDYHIGRMVLTYGEYDKKDYPRVNEKKMTYTNPFRDILNCNLYTVGMLKAKPRNIAARQIRPDILKVLDKRSAEGKSIFPLSYSMFGYIEPGTIMDKFKKVETDSFDKHYCDENYFYRMVTEDWWDEWVFPKWALQVPKN